MKKIQVLNFVRRFVDVVVDGMPEIISKLRLVLNWILVNRSEFSLIKMSLSCLGRGISEHNRVTFTIACLHVYTAIHTIFRTTSTQYKNFSIPSKILS